MTDQPMDPEDTRTDEIGRRMADVIEEQEDQVSERVDPRWELFYDDDHDAAEQIVHLHGDEKVPAKITTGSDGQATAQCTRCDATLEISAASREAMRKPAPATTR